MSGGGYVYDFTIAIPERLICKVCKFPSRDPYLSVCCGHTFCKTCSDAAHTNMKVCPVCEDNDFPVVQNKQNDREIKSLFIFCINKEKGCEWQGELNDINNHLGNSDGCQFEGVKCSNECGKMIERRYLTSHVETECPRRKVNCQYCHDTGEHQFIEGHHKKKCPKLPLPCPNKCEVGSVPREDMEMHRKKCQLEAIECSNECGKMIERRYLTSHVETECPRRKVKCQYCHGTGEHQFIEGQHKEKCPKLPLSCPNKCEVGSVPRECMKAHRKKCPLEIIQCEYHNVGCEVRMVRKDQEKHDNEKMKDHLMMTKHHLVLTKDHLCLLNKGIVTSTDCSLEFLLVNDNIMHSIPRLPVIIRMPGYSQLKETWVSSSFSVRLIGRTPTIFPVEMCLYVQFNGHNMGKSTCLSVYLYVTGGVNLFVSLPENKFCIKLLDHTDKKNHHVVIISRSSTFLSTIFPYYKVTSWPACYGGNEYFISLENLKQNSPFLSDDCLYFQVTNY